MVEIRNRSKKFGDLLENFSSSKECKTVPENEPLPQSNEYYVVMKTPTNEFVNLIQHTLPEDNSNFEKGGDKLLVPQASQHPEFPNLTNRTRSKTKLERPATPIPVRNQYENRKLSCAIPNANKPELKPKPSNSFKITDLKGDNYYILGGDTSQVNIIPPKPDRINIHSSPSVAKDTKESLNNTRKPTNYIVLPAKKDVAKSPPVSPLTKSMIFEDFSIDSKFSNFASEIRTKYYM